MSSLKVKAVRPKDLSHEELGMLFSARDFNLGKPAEFSHLLQNVWSGKWTLYRLDGDIKGIVVTNPEQHDTGTRLNIYYLTGEGLFGKMTALTNRLLDIARKEGHVGLSCSTHDPVRARLFRMTKGARCFKDGDRFVLELDHGRT